MRMMRMVRMESVMGSAKGMTGSKWAHHGLQHLEYRMNPNHRQASLKVQRGGIIPFRISLYVGAIVCSSLESQVTGVPFQLGPDISPAAWLRIFSVRRL